MPSSAEYAALYYLRHKQGIRKRNATVARQKRYKRELLEEFRQELGFTQETARLAKWKFERNAVHNSRDDGFRIVKGETLVTFD